MSVMVVEARHRLALIAELFPLGTQPFLTGAECAEVLGGFWNHF